MSTYAQGCQSLRLLQCATTLKHTHVYFYNSRLNISGHTYILYTHAVSVSHTIHSGGSHWLMVTWYCQEASANGREDDATVALTSRAWSSHKPESHTVGLWLHSNLTLQYRLRRFVQVHGLVMGTSEHTFPRKQALSLCNYVYGASCKAVAWLATLCLRDEFPSGDFPAPSAHTEDGSYEFPKYTYVSPTVDMSKADSSNAADCQWLTLPHPTCQCGELA